MSSFFSNVFEVTFKYFKTGDAINIDEYVPIKTPTIIANENPFKISPPKINIENNASNVVTDVINVLESVSLIEISETSVILILLYLINFHVFYHI